jgi:hypothetical protein
MIAFGNPGLAWGIGNGVRHGVVEPFEVILVALPWGLLLHHLFSVVDFIPEDEEEKSNEPVGR